MEEEKVMKKNKEPQNYLDRVPKRNESISWSVENDIVTLEIENTGVFNTIAQKLFKKPRISYIHLEEMGSFLWQLIDGKKSVFDFGKDVKEKFADKAEPLYERICKYFEILESYNFIKWKD